MRALLRWAGSKLSTLGQLSEHAPNQFQTYIEPFCGSASLFFYLEPTRAVLSDINADLVNFYNQFKLYPTQIQAYANAIPRNADTYYALRSHLKVCKCNFERSIIFFYLNRNCFNGLYRTDRSGNFNVPFAPSKTGNLPSQEKCIVAAKLLGNTDIIRSDFEDIVRNHARTGSFFFLDPPYAVQWRSPFTEYTPEGFGNKDLNRLLGCLEEIDDAGANFIMTYDASYPQALNVRRHWRQTKLSVRRNISGFASGRRIAEEIILVNH